MKHKSIETLFRKEAVRPKSVGLDGEVWLGTPFIWKIAISILLPLVFLGFIFALTSTYTKQESVAGWLIPHGGIIRIVARSGGVIEEIKVREGEHVSRLQVLGKLGLSTHVVKESVGASLEAATKAEISAIKGGGVASNSLIQEEMRNLEQQKRFLMADRETLKSVGINLSSKEKLISADLARMESLRTLGYVTQVNLDSKKADLLSAQQTTMQNLSALQSIERQIDDTESRIRTIPSRLAEQTSQRAAQTASLEQKLTQFKAQTLESVISPIDGTVAAIQAEVGQTLGSGGVLATITPGENNLEAELFVPTRAIGFIRTGQDVALHFQAFPYQRYGSGKGKVISISKTVMAPTDIPSLGVPVQEPVFRIRVSLSLQKIRAYGEEIPLQPGMLVNANIILEKRSLLGLLFDPILAVSERN